MPASARRSPGSPRIRSPRMLRITSEVPPSMVLARLRRNRCWMGPCQSLLAGRGALAVAVIQKSFRPKEIHAELVDVLVQFGADQLADRALRARASDACRGARALGRQPLRLRPQPQLSQPVAQHRRLQVRARRPQRDRLRDGARAAAAAAPAERRALVHQRGHRDAPAVADVSEPVLVRDAGVGEVDLVELGLPGQLAQRSGLDAWAVHVDDEVGQALVLGHVRVAACEQQSPAGPVREARPDLLPVDHPVVAVADGRGRPARPGPSPLPARRTADTRGLRSSPAGATIGV